METWTLLTERLDLNEREIFQGALDRADPADREGFLATACGANTALRARVDRLLQQHEQGPALDCPQWRIDGDATPTLFIGPAEQGQTESREAALRAIAPYLQATTRPDSLGRLAHYEILELLGHGGFGIVLKAFDDNLHRVVAVKLLHPQLAATSPPRKRFTREARAAAAIKHENVVHIHAIEEEPIPYLVMEYVDGLSLQCRLDGVGPLSPDEVVRVGIQIARGLAAAHEQGLVHRDIKPANLLIENGTDRRVKLTDFGLARAADAASMTQSGVLAGTPLYMSPEQAHGEDLDFRSDLFSLGSVLYTMVAGHPPFRAVNPIAVIKRVVEDTPRPLKQIFPETPPGLIAVIDRLLAKRREDRFDSARAVADALARCLTDPTVVAPRRHRRGLWRVGAVVGLTVTLVGLAIVALANLPARIATTGAPAPPPRESAKAIPDDPKLLAKWPHADWRAAVSTLDPRDQIDAVKARLLRLNPLWNFDKTVFRFKDGVIHEVEITAHEHLQDLSALAGLPHLTSLRVLPGPEPDWTTIQELRLKKLYTLIVPFRDLTPLTDMPLEEVDTWQTDATTIEPLRGKRLTVAQIGASRISDLSPLRGMPLQRLMIAYTPVSDLSPVADCPIEVLYCYNNNVTDLTPLVKCPLRELYLNDHLSDRRLLTSWPMLEVVKFTNYDPSKDFGILKSLPKLRMVNDRPVSEFLNDPDNQPPRP